MKRIILVLAVLTMVGVLIINAACSTSQASNTPGSTSTVTTSATSTTQTAVDGNYTVRIGFPSLVKDALAPEGPDLWALNQGLFDQEFSKDRIKVEYKPFLGAAPAINEALAAGSLDIAVIADIGALIGKAGGIKTSLTAMANPDGSPWWLLVSGSSNISKISDLKGKKVTTIKGTLPHFFLIQSLKDGGLQPSDIELINMNGPDSEQALRTGQIDATVTGGWKSQQLLKEGFKAVNSTKETPVGRGTMVIEATDSFIATHPSFFSRFYKVRQQATEWANNNRSAALDQLARAAGGIDRSLIEPLWPTPFNFDQSLTQEVLDRVKQGEKFLLELGLTRNAVDVDAWINKTVEY